jgi:hypothetical protein
VGARAIPLAVECPECGSAEVFYSCDPRCCFNHVCASCRASFFLSTHLLGEVSAVFPDLAVTPRGADTTGPTAPCARCQGIQVLSIAAGEGSAMCPDCGALLEVRITAVED